MSEPLFAERQQVRVRALLVGERLDLRALENAEHLATLPLTIRAGNRGCAVLFRYGAVVTFGLDALEEVSLLQHLKPFVREPFADDQIETEEAELVLDGDGGAANIPNGTIRLRDFSVERLQIVADVLAKSIVLAHYETGIGQAFDAIEPLAADLRTEPGPPHR